MRNIEAINANIARNFAFWRRAQGLNFQAATQGTEMRPQTLEAIEKRKEPPLAAHLLQLAAAWQVPVGLLALDCGEAFYQASERNELWHEVWCALLDVEEQGGLEKALANVIDLRDREAAE
jgi:transcriptional regulator with XRE-family HTH domain